MSPPHDLPSQDAAPPPFYPTQFHPEFGYLAPTLPFRRKAWLVCKVTVFGVIVGALSVIVLVSSRDPPPVVQSAHATPVMPPQALPVAPGDRWHLAPATVPYVPPTLAMPVASAVPQQRSGAAASLKGAPANPPTAEAPPSLIAKAPPVTARKKAARHAPKPRDVRPAEPDPRSAYAGSVRRFSEPQREWRDRRRFWNW